MTIWTGSTGAPATPTPSEHHLPPIPDADPRGPAPNGCTSPPFSRQSRASGRQRFTRTPAGWWAEHPARLPPPSQGQPPTHCQGDHTPRTRDQGSLRPTQALRKERGDSPPPQPQNRQATEGTSQHPGHDASGPRAYTEMTGTSGPQEAAGPAPAATPCLVPQQQEPSTEYVPGGHPGTTSRHPSLASAALDQDRLAFPPPPP